MRPISCSALLAILAAASIALVAPTDAGALPFQSQLTIAISVFEPVEIRGSGDGLVTARDGDHLAALAFDGGIFTAQQVVVPISDPASAPIRGLQATLSNDPASFAESAGGGFGGPMPLHGTVKVCLFSDCDFAVSNIEVPLSPIGAGGTTFATAAVNLTVYGAPWTAATASIGSIAVQGGMRGPAGETSSTAQVDGQLNLVTPVFVSTNLGVSSVVPVFGFLRLGFGSLFFPICDDGVDNDEDGLTDFPNDPGCANENDESETDPLRVCDDGLDNDGDGKTDFPTDPGCLARTDATEGPDLRCDVEMTQPTYQNGDTVALSSLRFTSLQDAPVPVRLRLQLRLPSSIIREVVPIDIGADGSFAIPGNFDKQLGPVTMFTMTETEPPFRTNFEWRCSLEDPATGEVFFEDRAPFYLYQ